MIKVSSLIKLGKQDIYTLGLIVNYEEWGCNQELKSISEEFGFDCWVTLHVLIEDKVVMIDYNRIEDINKEVFVLC